MTIRVQLQFVQKDYIHISTRNSTINGREQLRGLFSRALTYRFDVFALSVHFRLNDKLKVVKTVQTHQSIPHKHINISIVSTVQYLRTN